MGPVQGFFCAAGPISFSNAPYETCKLEIAFKPTLKRASITRVTKMPMKIPMHRSLSIFPVPFLLVEGGEVKCERTRGEKLVFLKQRPRIICCCLRRYPRHHLPLQVHMHRLLELRFIEHFLGGGGRVDHCVGR